MAWIQQRSDQEATGLLEKIYHDARRRAGKVYNILRIQSVNPEVLRAGLGLYMQTMHAASPVPRVLREMIATVVSRLNTCHY